MWHERKKMKRMHSGFKRGVAAGHAASRAQNLLEGLWRCGRGTEIGQIEILGGIFSGRYR